jgi:dTDP-4-dehydrorhamnose 3,5-epimerase-like enzyme
MFNDKDLNIDWQIENPITSEKDMHGEAFAEFVSPFEY